MRVLITDDTHPVLAGHLEKAGCQVVVNAGLNREALLLVVDEFDALVVRSKIVIDRAFVDCCHRLRCIGRVGAGMETIDVEYAQSRGIVCVNSPEGNRDAVGEHTLGLLLALFDKIARADAEVRNGLWRREANRGLEVKGKKIGIVGFGNMGGSFAQRLYGFECEVLAYDVLGAAASGFARRLPYVRAVSLDELQAEADVLSLHVPLTPETRYMVDAAFIDAFAKPLFLVNTSRGAVVDTSHLVDAMKQGKVVGAALDVVEYEAMAADGLAMDKRPADFEWLLSSERTVMTPHVAGWTVESKYKLAAVLADKIVAVLNAPRSQGGCSASCQ